MSLVSLAVTGWPAGELSPLLRARHDLAARNAGAAELINMLPLPQGPVTRRPGTQWVGPSPFHRHKLVPFVFSRSDTYLLLFEGNDGGIARIRLIRNGGFVLATSGAHYAIATPYADLDKLAVAQINDVLVLVHPDHAPRLLKRRDHTDWLLDEMVTSAGPYAPREPGEVSIAVATTATSGQISLTASSDLFAADQIGKPWRLESRWVRIVAVADPRNATAETTLPDPLDEADARKSNKNLHDANNNADPPARWPAAAWLDMIYRQAHPASGVAAMSPAPPVPTPITDWQAPAWTSGRGWPSAVLWRDQRLWFAASRAQPTTIWATAVGQTSNFRPGSNDDDSLTLTLTGIADPILWLAADRAIVAASASRVWTIAAGQAGGAITPTSLSIRATTDWGASPAQPVQADNAVLFIDRAERRLLRIKYDWGADAYVCDDLTALAEHIGRYRLKQAVAVRGADPIIWCRDAQEQLAALTYEPAQQLVAWSRHKTDGRVVALASLPEPGGDVLYLVVARSGGYGVERLMPRQDHADITPFDWWLLDSALRWSSATPAGTIAGLDHLAGKRVTALTDHGPISDLAVTSGHISLPVPVAWAIIGLSYQASLTTMPINAGSADGAADGRPKRILRAYIHCLDSIGGWFGSPGGTHDPLTRHRADGSPGIGPMISDSIAVTPPGGWRGDGQLTIRQPDPLPMTICGLTLQIETSDGAAGTKVGR